MNSVQKTSTEILLTDFELRENRHSESYNFREGVHDFFPPYFLLFLLISGTKISAGDLYNILLCYFGFLENLLREGHTFLVQVNGVTFTRVQ